jgi:hypothetical protein
MILAIDFDGTIMDPNNKNPGYRMGQPFPGAISVINHWVKLGHQVIIFTARNVNKPEAHKAVADWLDYYKIPHHGITNIKQPYFDVMIDDKCLQFKSWSGMLFKVKQFDVKQ